MMPKLHTAICEHFKLGKIPFLKRTKLPFIYDSFEENLLLLSSVFYARQATVVFGPSGSGKTSLIFYALNQLDPAEFRVVSCELSNPKKGAIYKTLAVKMGLNPAFRADDIKLQLIDFFHEENAQGKFNCVIIDEAHSLSIPMLDELRSFYDEGNNFSLILSGLPNFINRKLNLTLTLPLKQRVSLFLELSGLSLKETKDYINHQMQRAKAKNSIIDDKSFPKIHSLTAGIPRKINQLCYGALVKSYQNEKIIIDENIIQNVSDELAYN